MPSNLTRWDGERLVDVSGVQLGSFAVTIILLPRHLDLSARKRRERKRERILRKWPVGSMPLPTDPYHDDNTTFFCFVFCLPIFPI